WLTVRQYEGVTNTKEAERLVKEGLVPLIAKLPGFISYYWTDAGNGVMISVSVYTNKEAEEESNRIAADFVKQHMAALLPNPPRISAGQVVTMAQKKSLSRVFLDEKYRLPTADSIRFDSHLHWIIIFFANVVVDLSPLSTSKPATPQSSWAFSKQSKEKSNKARHSML